MLTPFAMLCIAFFIGGLAYGAWLRRRNRIENLEVKTWDPRDFLTRKEDEMDIGGKARRLQATPP